jgi:hemolysin activation/secretion protein
MKKFLIAVILFFLFLRIGIENLCFAQAPTVSQIERTQEILDKEKVLREKLLEEEKIFINKILVEGISLLTEDQIKDIILPFQRKWLTKKDIQHLLELIKEAYKLKGYTGQPTKISYQIKKKQLIIRVEEFALNYK